MLGLDKVLIKRVITFAARRGLSVIGVMLIERGWVDANDWTQVALALAPVVADLAWSLYEKSQADKKVTTALALPEGSTHGDLAEAMKPKAA